MKLTLPGTRRIEGGEIELDGITVLCGYNNTGKRDVCDQIVAAGYGAVRKPALYRAGAVIQSNLPVLFPTPTQARQRFSE